MAEVARRNLMTQSLIEFNDAWFQAPPLVNERVAVEPSGRDWDRLLKLEYERQMLGRYVSDHPLSDCTHELDAFRFADLARIQDAEASELPDGTLVDTAGMFVGLHRRQRGKSIWLSGELEDEQRSIEFSCWMDVWQAHFRQIRPYIPVGVQAFVKRSDDRPMTLVLHTVQMLTRHADGCTCSVPEGEVSDPPAMTEDWRRKLRELEDLRDKRIAEREYWDAA